MNKTNIAASFAALAIFLSASPEVLAKPKAKAAQAKCPDTWDSNKCAYFQDGFKAGKEDRGANMSMAHERHSDAYDSRFEEAYSVGYEEGWKKGK
jgi:hypothetical protein